MCRSHGAGCAVTRLDAARCQQPLRSQQASVPLSMRIRVLRLSGHGCGHGARRYQRHQHAVSVLRRTRPRKGEWTRGGNARAARRPTTPLTHTASGVPLRGGSLQPSSASTAPSRRGSSETMTVRLPGGLPRHSVSPYLACASLQERCDLSHTLWSPERGTFPRISDACQEGGYRRRTFQHGLIRCSP